LTDLKLPKKGEKITYLDIKNNNFAEQDLTRFSQLFNCQKLSIGYSSKISALPFEDILERRDNYNKFTNSLEYLQNCSLLELLDVSNTDIDSDLEYLPKSLRYFYCSTDHRSKAKCQTIYNLFVNQQGEVEIEKDGYILNFPQKLHDYKQWRKLNFAEKEIKE
jgi:Leucine-rich repeat (LRR) protein